MTKKIWEEKQSGEADSCSKPENLPQTRKPSKLYRKGIKFGRESRTSRLSSVLMPDPDPSHHSPYIQRWGTIQWNCHLNFGFWGCLGDSVYKASDSWLWLRLWSWGHGITLWVRLCKQCEVCLSFSSSTPPPLVAHITLSETSALSLK